MAKKGLVSLKRTKEDKKADNGHGLASPGGDNYPYGTRLRLDHETMDKLGMDTPRVGDKMHVHGHAHVTSVSEDHHEGGKKRRNVELQLSHMMLQPGEKDGHAGGKHASAAAGAKAAMDAALHEPDGDETD